jgi:SAM-dependent methyltransferase
MFREIKDNIKTVFAPPHSIFKFLMTINKTGTLADIGCGNNSPYYIKTHYPKIYYIGIDIGDYNQTKPNLADKYIIAKPDEFADAIANIKVNVAGECGVDTVISSHNLEHCNDRKKTLDAMINILKPGGKLFLSFPTKKSVSFPHRDRGNRKGVLNYYDDLTHQYGPPDFDGIIKQLEKNNFDIIFSSASHKPIMYFLIGLILEPLSKLMKRSLFNSYATWAYWGFESIIWARKRDI